MATIQFLSNLQEGDVFSRHTVSEDSKVYLIVAYSGGTMYTHVINNYNIEEMTEVAAFVNEELNEVVTKYNNL